jgi:arsenite/tail-anchored protein-transporting ATPase
LGISNQCLALNGWFTTTTTADPVATRWRERQAEALSMEGAFIGSLARYRTPLLPGNLLGLDALRGLFAETGQLSGAAATADFSDECPELPGLDALADQLAGKGRGVILTMGKGGVGKTTVAAALGLALADRGASVHLSTTDPAAHLHDALGDAGGNMSVERIDPKAETQAYVEDVLATKGADMDAESRALLVEDLRSPCTEEIAVFRAFARTVAKGEDGFVVLDTAPTGHTLLLLDATQSYHRELGRQTRSAEHPEEVDRLLPRLRDPQFTHVLLVTIPEATPVHEAAALQADLRRAQIEPRAWIINQSLAGTRTEDPLLAARGRAEIRYIREVIGDNPGAEAFLIPWSAVDPVGEAGLRHLRNNSPASPLQST